MCNNNKVSNFATPKTNRLSFYKQCQKNLNSCSFYTKIGVTETTAKKFLLGYNDETDSLILPLSENRYAQISNDYKVSYPDGYAPFNIKKSTGDIVFITQNELDALAVIELGFTAVSLDVSTPKHIDDFCGLMQERSFNGYLVSCNPQICKSSAAFIAIRDSFSIADNSNIIDNTNTTLHKMFTQNQNSLRAKLTAIHQALQAKLNRRAGSILGDVAEIIIAKEITDLASTVIQTGFDGLDKLIGSGLRGGLHMIGAAPGTGKSTFVNQIALHCSRHNQRVLFFHTEMREVEYADKFMRCALRIHQEENGAPLSSYPALSQEEKFTDAERQNYSTAMSLTKDYGKHLVFLSPLAEWILRITKTLFCITKNWTVACRLLSLIISKTSP